MPDPGSTSAAQDRVANALRLYIDSAYPIDAADAHADLNWLLAEIDYFRVRMMVAVSFLDSGTLDKFHEHVAEIDAKHREASRV